MRHNDQTQGIQTPACLIQAFHYLLTVALNGGQFVVTNVRVQSRILLLNVRADKAEANKCDLCNHREDGPACMAACPTHALICVDRNKLEQLSAEKRRRTALMF